MYSLLLRYDAPRTGVRPVSQFGRRRRASSSQITSTGADYEGSFSRAPNIQDTKHPVGFTTLRLLKAVVRGIRSFTTKAHRDNVLFLASALSFDALLAAVPLALLLLSILGYVIKGVSEQDLSTMLQLILPAHTQGMGDPVARAERLITAVVTSRQDLTLYGMPLFLVFSTRLFASASIALNQILRTHAKRPFLLGILRDLVLVVVTTVLFAANSLVAIPVFDVSWLDRLVGHFHGVGFGATLFFVVYSLAPDRPLKWDTAVVAGLFAATAFEFAKLLFGAYLVEFATVNRVISHANAIALILFVVWVYYTALIFLLGGEVARVYQTRRYGHPPSDVNERHTVSFRRPSV